MIPAERIACYRAILCAYRISDRRLAELLKMMRRAHDDDTGDVLRLIARTDQLSARCRDRLAKAQADMEAENEHN